MFVRYLGGGIGHLEQFPSADNSDKVATVADNDDIEIETDCFIMEGDSDDSDGGKEYQEVGEN